MTSRPSPDRPAGRPSRLMQLLACPRTAALLAVGFGALLAGATVWRSRPADPLPEATVVVEGTVRGFAVSRTPEGGVLRLDYTYEAEGRRVGSFATATVPAEMIPTTDRYSAGAPVPVRYVSGDPTRSVIDGFPDRLPLTYEPDFLLGLGLILFGAIYGLARRRG